MAERDCPALRCLGAHRVRQRTMGRAGTPKSSHSPDNYENGGGWWRRWRRDIAGPRLPPPPASWPASARRSLEPSPLDIVRLDAPLGCGPLGQEPVEDAPREPDDAAF